MKLIKNLVLSLAFVNLISFYGCDFVFQKKEKNTETLKTEENNTLELEGVLKSLGSAAVSGTKFFIEDSKGKIYLLKDGEAKISNNFLDREILVEINDSGDGKTYYVNKIDLKGDDFSYKNEDKWENYENEFNFVSFTKKSSWIVEQKENELLIYLKNDEIENIEEISSIPRIKLTRSRWNNSQATAFEEYIYKKSKTRIEKIRSAGFLEETYKPIESDLNLFFLVKDSNYFEIELESELDEELLINTFLDFVHSVKINEQTKEAMLKDNLLEDIENKAKEDTEDGLEDKSPDDLGNLKEQEEKSDISVAVASEEEYLKSSETNLDFGKAINLELEKENNKLEVIDKIKSEINNIVPEKSENGDWVVKEIQFVDPNYAYIDYENSSIKRKILIKYNFTGNVFETIGYFEPGEEKDWVIVSGDNPTASQEKVSYSISENGEIDDNLVIKSGFRYFESKPYKFKIQYPLNWYYSATNEVGSSATYMFSEKPIDNLTEAKVLLRIVNSLETASDSDIPTLINYQGSDAWAVKRNLGGYFIVSSTPEFSDIIKLMAGSIIQ